MSLTPEQAHVLANLNRIVPLESTLKTVSSRRRYQLDGSDCTSQIRSLLTLDLISAYANGQFRRRDASETNVRDQRVGERQRPLASSLAQIRAFLSPTGGE